MPRWFVRMAEVLMLVSFTATIVLQDRTLALRNDRLRLQQEIIELNERRITAQRKIIDDLYALIDSLGPQSPEAETWVQSRHILARSIQGDRYCCDRQGEAFVCRWQAEPP